MTYKIVNKNVIDIYSFGERRNVGYHFKRRQTEYHSQFSRYTPFVINLRRKTVTPKMQRIFWSLQIYHLFPYLGM